MLRDAHASLVEMVVGLLWPINAPLEWAITRFAEWVPNNKFKLFEGLAVIIAVAVFYIEFQVDRPRDRAVRIATLFAQIAEVHALPDGKVALQPSVEALARERVSMRNMNLAGAIMRNAKLGGADLFNVDLRAAILSGANLSAANLSAASFNGTKLLGANLSAANLEQAAGLMQSQLNLACADPDNPPQNLPKDEDGNQLVWRGKPCQ